MKTLEYSVIIKVDNLSNLEHTLNSIKIQKYNLNNIEILIIDLSDSKNEIFKNIKFNKLNIKYFDCKENNYISTLNNVISLCNGNYINIIDNNNYYNDNDVFSKLDNIKNKSKSKIIAIHSLYFDIDEQKSSSYKMQPKDTNEISLLENPFDICLNLNSYFISKDIYNEVLYDSSFDCEYKYKFIIDLFRKYTKYYYLHDISISTYTPFETNTSKNSIQYEKSWYIKSLDNFLNYLKNEVTLPLYIQNILLYTVYSKINCNVYDRNKRVLTKDEAIIFFDRAVKLSKYIDNEILIRYLPDEEGFNYNYNFKMQRWIRYYLFKKKMSLPETVYIEDNKIVLEYIKDGKKLKYYNNDIKSEVVNVYAINYKDGKLVFDCSTSLGDILDDNQFEIIIKHNNKIIKATRSYFYPLLKVFGKTIKEKYCFNFSIDITNPNGKIEALALINNQQLTLNFSYAKVAARLCNSQYSFWHYKNFVLYNKIKYIEIKKAKKLNLVLSEIKFDSSLFKNEKNKKRVVKLVGLRMLYYMTKPFYKNVWLTWDKLYKAGDNGEYMYQYLLNKNKNIYYFIKKDSPDYKRLKSQNKKRCVVFNSLKAKLLSLHSQVILDTHANVISYCGFDGISRNFACGLFNPEIICIQHGLTIQKIAQYQNRLFDNIKHYCCASQFEIDNMSHPFYDYDKSQMTITGLARYDGLKSRQEKIILITPTWRRNVVNSSVAYIKKKHNNNFKNSDYFTIYNSLINNKELIECAKKEGYKIIYLLHPAMSGQFQDFTRNDYVEIVAATSNMNYEDILTRSSLMVTDYSGVQFDFAYQRKALIYYHPDKLPPHYDDGGLEYETMGFGPICKTEQQVVKELCENMKNGCIIKDKYRQRANQFFKFSDFNNCERILNVVDNYLHDIHS